MFCFFCFFYQKCSTIWNDFLSSHFFFSLKIYGTIPCQITFLPLFIFSFSNQLQLLIFLIRHLDYSVLSSFTNQGPFVWKHEDKNMQQKPLKAILMLCLRRLCNQLSNRSKHFFFIHLYWTLSNKITFAASSSDPIKKNNVFHFWWSLFMFAKVYAGKGNKIFFTAALPRHVEGD